MKTEEKPTKQYDTRTYMRALRKANKELNKLQRIVSTCSIDDLDKNLRLYRAAELKVKQLEDRIDPPLSGKYDIEPLQIMQ